MKQTMNVHPFHVAKHDTSQPLESLLEEIYKTNIEDRLKTIGSNEIRIEAIERPTPSFPYWLMDFTKLRFDNGPGKISRTEPITNFDLDKDEGFGEETACLFDPKNKKLLVQYNHYGVRSALIQAYFSGYKDKDINLYDLAIQLDRSSELKLAQKKVIKKIQFKIAPIKMGADQRANGISLEKSLELNSSVNGEHIEVTISSGRNANSMLNFDKAKELIDGLRSLVRTDDEHQVTVVEKFEVTAKDNAMDKSEAINMLLPKLEATIDGLILDVVSRRYTRDSRWKGLARALNYFKTISPDYK